MKDVLFVTVVSLALGILGCEKSQEKPTPKESAKPAASNQPTAPSGSGGHSGALIELGSVKIGSFEVRASRDAGDIKPGGDAPVDVWIDGGLGKGVTAVRFWIGTQDAKGSIKAKAEIEDGKWHTHVEIPSPTPAGSKLWVEIESEKGEKAVGSYGLTPVAGERSNTAGAGGKQKLEAGCATCIFKMPGVSGCKLAVKIDGKPYLVKGVEMDALGDPHAPDGLCNKGRTALVEGKVEGGVFIASSVELTPN